jgi:hypothetical protein
MEGADQVLALGRVDPGLAAHRGIHLGQERGRDLHEAHPTAHQAGRQTGKIADHATAEGHDEAAALQPHLQEALAQARQSGEALGRFAGRQHHRAGMPVKRSEPLLQRGEVTLGDILVRDDGASRRPEAGLDQIWGPRQKP